MARAETCFDYRSTSSCPSLPDPALPELLVGVGDVAVAAARGFDSFQDVFFIRDLRFRDVFIRVFLYTARLICTGAAIVTLSRGRVGSS